MVSIPGVNYDIGGTIAKAWSTGSLMLYVILAILGIAGVWYVFFRPRTYKIKVIIWQLRAGSIIFSSDKGLVTNKKAGLINFFRGGDNFKRLRLLYKKVEIPAPGLEYFTKGDSGEDVLQLYRFGQSDYQPVTVKDIKDKFDELQLIPSEEDMKLWYQQETKDLIKRNTPMDKMQRLLIPLLSAGLLVTIIVVTYLLMGAIKTNGALVQSIAEAQRLTAEAIKDAVSMLISAKTGGAVPPA